MTLTKQELSILILMVTGQRQKKIARVLNISPSTVAGYSKTIYLKMRAHSRSELQFRVADEMKIIVNNK